MKGFKTMLAVIVVILISSCETMKNIKKNKDKSEIKTKIVSVLKRVGDTVSFSPTEKHRDTVIHVYNKSGSKLSVTHNSSGDVSYVKCEESDIHEHTTATQWAKINKMEVNREIRRETKMLKLFLVIAVVFFVIRLIQGLI